MGMLFFHLINDYLYLRISRCLITWLLEKEQLKKQGAIFVFSKYLS